MKLTFSDDEVFCIMVGLTTEWNYQEFHFVTITFRFLFSFLSQSWKKRNLRIEVSSQDQMKITDNTDYHLPINYSSNVISNLFRMNCVVLSQPLAF